MTQSDLVEGEPTPGMRRQAAFKAPSLWAGIVHIDPDAASAWHHHGDHDTSLYVVSGRLRVEFGPGGDQVVEAGADEFICVPARTTHRQSNPGKERSMIVVARSGGDGPSTIHVDGPDAE